MIKVKHLKRKNPKDEEFLELIKVKRNLVNNLYLYDIYYRNEKIGQFIILKGDNYIHEMEIFDDKYKRRGLATFMRDYIEKDLGIKIVTSSALSKAGERFYQAREKSKKKNPTDKEFLKTIHIKKEHDDLHNTIIYLIYRNEDKSKYDRFGRIPKTMAIANAYYDTKDKWVYDLAVSSKFQRKGLATYLYDYIEQDQKIKLKPSDYLLEPGKAFWKNRLKNPRDEELLSKIKIKKEYYDDSATINYLVTLNNQVIATAIFDQYMKYVDLVRTLVPFQRKGVASYLYDYIEQDQGIKLKPSDCLLVEGKAFWRARRKATR